MILSLATKRHFALVGLLLASGCGSNTDTKPDGSLPIDGAPGDSTTDNASSDVPPATCTIIPAFQGGILTADLVLTKACSPYSITSDIRVEGNATLTIEPGVVVKLAKGVELTVAYNGAGKLVAEGTAADPIVLTSGAATPTPGDWAGITFYSDSMTGSRLKYVTLDYCGQSGGACVEGVNGLTSGVVTIDQVTVDHVGAAADGIVENGSDQKFAITNTTFKTGAIATGRYAISLDAGSFVAVGAGNIFNGAPINIDGGYVATNASWINPGTPIVVTAEIRVEGTTSPVLTVAAGTTLQFANGIGLSIGYGDAGQLVAEGTATAPIVFTSKSATPGRGDWSGISLWDGTANGTKVAYAKLDYCGLAGEACIDATAGVKSDRVTIDHVIIDHVGASADGISENGATSRFKVTNTTFPTGAITTGNYAIYVNAASFGAIGTNNTFNSAMIRMWGGYIENTTSWSNPGTDIAVTEEIRVEGASTPVLTIGPGMTFKFGAGRSLAVGYGDPGKLVAAGTSTARITFTSLASSPGKGDWEGITAWNSGQVTLTYSDVMYGGNDAYHGCVTADGVGSTVSVTNSTVSNSGSYGVYVDCNNVNVTTPGTTFSNNTSGDKGPGPTCP